MAKLLVLRKLYFVLQLLLSYDNAKYTYSRGGLKNFVGFNSTITTRFQNMWQMLHFWL